MSRAIHGSSRITAATRAQIVKLLPTIGSLRELSAATGLRLDVVRREAKPLLAAMKLNGTHPQCGCGRDRFHQYGCADSRAKSWPSDCLPGCTREETAIVLARRAIIIPMLIAGDRQIDIDRALGATKGTARNCLRFLTDEQAELRERRMATRGTAPFQEPTRPFSDPLYARIALAVPRWVTNATRDDIISEMYLAVKEGALREQDIEANAKRFANKCVNMWESKYAPRSLDVSLFEAGSRTLGETIPDPSALEAFDRIRIGEHA